jgi:hypothetical protein
MLLQPIHHLMKGIIYYEGYGKQSGSKVPYIVDIIVQLKKLGLSICLLT